MREKDNIFSKIKNNFYNFKVWLYHLLHKKPVREKKMKSAHYKRVVFYATFMALPLLQLAIFYFAVNFNSVTMAFKKYNIETGQFDWAGFYNFKNLFYNLSLPGDPLIVGLKNSLILFVCNTGIGVTLALFFSYYIYKKRFASELFRVLLFLPQILSLVVMVIMFKYFTDKAIPEFISKVFHKNVMGILSQNSTRFTAIIIFSIWSGFATNVLMYVNAMSGLPVEVGEAAKLDGVSPMREFFQIVLPLIYPTITAFLVIALTGIFTSQAAIFEFFGEKLPDQQLYTIGYYLFRHVLYSSGLNNYAYASAAGILATCIAGPITLLGKFILEQIDPNKEA